MSFEKRREIASFFMRVMVGFILIYSGYIKISEPLESFISSIMAYKVVNDKIAYYIALALPWAEVYLGIFLVFGLFNKIIIKISSLCFFVFEFLLMQAMIRGLEITECGCFGSMHSNPIGIEFVLNLVWLFFLYMGYRYSPNISLDRFVENKFKEP
jgi:uncharacterized membrane protein YphA (DoxX/SURF4 family)